LKSGGSASFHEDLRREEETARGSDRSFGFVFAGFCAVVAAYMLWHTRIAFWSWLAAAGTFALVAVTFPLALRPLNLLWFRFGMLLHHVITPVVLGLMFYTVFTPIGLWMRLIGKRPLHLPFDARAKSYWVERTPPGPSGSSFINQF